MESSGWCYIDDAAEAMRLLGDRRDLNREAWGAHYAKLRTERSGRYWYTGDVGQIFGVTIYRNNFRPLIMEVKNV